MTQEQSLPFGDEPPCDYNSPSPMPSCPASEPIRPQLAMTSQKSPVTSHRLTGIPLPGLGRKVMTSPEPAYTETCTVRPLFYSDEKPENKECQMKKKDDDSNGSDKCPSKTKPPMPILYSFPMMQPYFNGMPMKPMDQPILTPIHIPHNNLQFQPSPLSTHYPPPPAMVAIPVQNPMKKRRKSSRIAMDAEEEYARQKEKTMWKRFPCLMFAMFCIVIIMGAAVITIVVMGKCK